MSLRGHVAWLGIFLIPLGAVLVTTCGPPVDSTTGSAEPAATPPAGAPEVLITIEKGNRQVRVAGQDYGRGSHRPDSVNWLDVGQGRRGLDVGAVGAKAVAVSMASAGLDTIHIDASARRRPVTLVYGMYDDKTAASSATAASILPVPSALPRNWECIWCPGELLVCGVEPECDGVGADSMAAGGGGPN